MKFVYYHNNNNNVNDMDNDDDVEDDDDHSLTDNLDLSTQQLGQVTLGPPEGAEGLASSSSRV